MLCSWKNIDKTVFNACMKGEGIPDFLVKKIYPVLFLTSQGSLGVPLKCLKFFTDPVLFLRSLEPLAANVTIGLFTVVIFQPF